MKGRLNMKLADLGLKKVYCVVYEQDGKVLTTYEEKHMNRILELYSGKCVEVYNPHGENRKEILRLLDGGRQGTEKVELKGSALLRSIELLTNIDFGDLTTEQAQDIIDNPGALLETVCNEVSSIHISLLKNQFAVAQSLASMPEAVRRPLTEKLVQEATSEEDAKRKQEMEELEKQMKELEERKQALMGNGYVN